MSIKATLHPFLNDGVELELEVEGKTVGECIKSILKRHPEMEKKMFGKNGALKGYVEVLANGRGTGPNELAYQVKDGDVLSVLVFLSGG
jgi:molybdopterin converting factor small subunit